MLLTNCCNLWSVALFVYLFFVHFVTNGSQWKILETSNITVKLPARMDGWEVFLAAPCLSLLFIEKQMSLAFTINTVIFWRFYWKILYDSKSGSWCISQPEHARMTSSHLVKQSMTSSTTPHSSLLVTTSKVSCYSDFQYISWYK